MTYHSAGGLRRPFSSESLMLAGGTCWQRPQRFEETAGIREGMDPAAGQGAAGCQAGAGSRSVSELF